MSCHSVVQAADKRWVVVMRFNMTSLRGIMGRCHLILGLYKEPTIFVGELSVGQDRRGLRRSRPVAGRSVG